MLNTNQSNQRKSWKYALILPVLSAFMLLFQVETVAQVKENLSSTNSKNNSSIITKNTSDEELKKLEKTYSVENQKLQITNVKRDKNGEIIEIKLTLDSGKTYNKVLERKSFEPINDIRIFVNSDGNNVQSVDFKEIDSKAAYAVETENISEYNYVSLDNLKKDGKEVVLIINGQIKGAEEKIKLLKNEKLGERKQISATEFKKKYHQKADKNKLYFEVKTMALDYEFVTTTFDVYDLIETRFQMKNEIVNDNQKALYYFNDKEITSKVAKNIKGELITEIIQILPNTTMVAEYGEKGKYGVVKINSETKSTRNKLYIINGKEVLQSEIPKGTTISLDGMINDLSNEEGIKKYGQKAKDGVLIFNGKSIFVTEEDQVKTEIESAKNEIDISKPEIERSRIEIEKENRKVISGGNWSDVEKELKKERELKAQQNLKLSTEELEVRRAKREKILNERRKLMEEKKKQLEIRRKEIEEKTKK